MEKNNCNICIELAGDSEQIEYRDYGELVKHGKNVLMETRGFCVIPSFGPLDKSHVMIVPKKHVNSFALIEGELKGEVEFIIDALSNYYLERFKERLFFFESGAGSSCDHSGGCIVHAHIHCVASTDRFESLLSMECSLTKVDDDTLFDTTHGYIWFRNENGDAYYCNRPLLPSQFLRYLYLISKNVNKRWNWRRDINIKEIGNVISAYSGLNI